MSDAPGAGMTIPFLCVINYHYYQLLFSGSYPERHTPYSYSYEYVCCTVHCIVLHFDARSCMPVSALSRLHPCSSHSGVWLACTGYPDGKHASNAGSAPVLSLTVATYESALIRAVPRA